MKQIFIDTETTGLTTKHAVVQIGALIIIDGAIIESFEYNVRPFPNDAVDANALQINGLTIDQISKFDPPDLIYAKLYDILSMYIDKYNPKDKLLWLGYYAQFDSDMLRAFFKKNNDSYFGSWFFTPPIDVMSFAAYCLQAERDKLDNFKQSTVAKHLGLDVDESKTHSALYDAQITKAIADKLEGRFIAKSS